MNILKDSYSFHFIQHEYDYEDKPKEVKKRSLYHFKSDKSNLWYIVEVEHYNFDVFIIKFYLKSHRRSKDKFRFITNTKEPRKIIYTCINIMLSIFYKNEQASFGFIGANSFGEERKETKRFRVYSRIIATYFTSRYFYHKENIDTSSYILINNNALNNDPQLIEEIEDLFNDIYIVETRP